jgi:uncharacterized protein
MADTVPELSERAKSFKPGLYKHFKGGMYRALFVARLSENRSKEVVVYQSIDTEDIWVRPLEMFLESVNTSGYHGPRFSLVSKEN